MHSVLAALDSSSPSVLLILGFTLILGSRLARRLAGPPASAVEIAGGHSGIEQLSQKVVSIDRRIQVPQTPRLAERRVS
jgi:hypothetical protein